MEFANWFVLLIVAPGHLVAEIVEVRLKLPGWLGGIAGLLAVVVWIVFLIVVAYHLVTSALLFFA